MMPTMTEQEVKVNSGSTQFVEVLLNFGDVFIFGLSYFFFLIIFIPKIVLKICLYLILYHKVFSPN